MKKISHFSILVIVLFSLGLTSCENFFSGNNFLEELNDSLFYNNLPEFSVSVTNLNPEWGTITTGSGDHKVRVTDKIVLNFEVNEGYYFDKWQVVNKNNRNEVIADCIEFEYPQNKSANAVAKISQQNENMMIVPVCCECLIVESFYPDQTDLIYPKNSSISISFNYDIPTDLPENDVSQISIKITGIPNALEYFNTPVIIDNKIIISSKADKKIPVSAGEVKVVTVSIPETFVCNVDGEYLSLGKAFIFSYSIDSSTSTKANVVIANGEDKNAYFAADEIVATGVPGMYNIEQVIKLSYRPTADYKFVGFNSSDEQSVIIGEVTYDSFTGCYTANATVLNAKRDENGTVVNVVINPVVEKVYKLSVKVEGKNGKSTPVIETSYYNGESFNVTFNAETDFGFTGWKYSLNGKEFTPSDKEIVSVKDISTDTYYSEIELKVEKEPEENQQLVITPVTVKRPSIVSATPLYDTEGVYRDRRITIMFDAALSEESLYYSKYELIALGVWDAKKDNVAEGYTLLDTAGNKKYFGYQKTDDDDSIVWKAITITKRTNTNENLLKYYRGPEFDTNDTSVLRISANSDVKKMPPVATDILVKVNTNLGITVTFANGKKDFVPLSNTYSWNYFTNSLYDNVKPEISELALYTVKSGNKKFKDEIDKNKVLFSYHKEKDPSITDFTCDDFKNDVKKSENIAAYNLSEGKVWIQAKVTDGGSGPKSLSATITKVTGNDFYPEKQDTKIDNVSYTAKLSITGSVALTYCDDEYNGEFFDVSSLDPGLYKMTFTAYDKNDQDSEIKEAYFIYDKAGPILLPLENITNLRTKVEDESVSWSQNPTGDGAEDFDHIEVECWDGENQIDVTKIQSSKDTKQLSFTGLTEKKPYEYRFYSVDYAGNRSSNYTTYTDKTHSVVQPGSVTNTRTSAEEETLTWTNPGVEADYLIIDRCLDGKVEYTFTQNADDKEITKKFENLTNQKKYEYRFYTVDYAGNKSTDYYTYKDNTGPTSLTSNCTGSRIKATEETVNWTNPTGNDVDHIEIDCYYNDNTTKKTTFVQSPANKVTTNKFTGLTNQTKYTYRFYSVDYSGNRSSTYSTYVDNIGAAKPVNIITGSLNGGIRLIFDAPNDDEFDHFYIPEATSENVTGKHGTAKVMGKTNGTSYECSVYAVDFAGNKSEPVTVTEKAGIKPVYCCYLNEHQDIYFTESLREGDLNLVGIVIANGHYSDSWITGETVRIMDLKLHNSTPPTVVYDHNKDSVPSEIDSERNDGFRVYKNVKAYNYFDRCPRYKYLYEKVNNYDKNPIIWYLPSLNEMLELNSYEGSGFSGWNQRNPINNLLSKIPESIPHMVQIPRSGEFATSTLWNNRGTPSGYTVYWLNSDYWAGYTLSGNEGISYADYLLMAQINPAY